MRLLVFLMAATLVAMGLLPLDTAQAQWKSAHISITKFAAWSEFLDALDQPHIDVTIHNDGTESVGTLDCHCKLLLLDRALPIFEDSWSADLDQVIRPGQNQTLKLKPNMFSELGRVIQHRYQNASWSCFVSRVLTASGQSITFEPGQLPVDGPPFGVGYAPVPDAMAPKVKVPPGSGMWLMMVQPQSAAEAAGLKVGDVVLSIDGRPLKVIADLPSVLRDARAAGRAAHLSVVRTGQQLDLLVPPPDPVPPGASARNLPRPAADGAKP